MKSKRDVLGILNALCVNVSVLEHQHVPEERRKVIRENVNYLYARADEMGIPFIIQNSATKAGFDHDLRIAYLDRALVQVYMQAEQWLSQIGESHAV